MKVKFSLSPSGFNDYFISHMVQMKERLKHLIRNSEDLFISHMVQMKVVSFSCTCCRSRSCLYIPHGSDERENQYSEDCKRHPLYPTWFRWKSLVSLPAALMDCFISHMVQMKVNVNFAILRDFLGFISHMVQMKVFLRYGIYNKPITLYPTWFRWK